MNIEDSKWVGKWISGTGKWVSEVVNGYQEVVDGCKKWLIDNRR